MQSSSTAFLGVEPLRRSTRSGRLSSCSGTLDTKGVEYAFLRDRLLEPRRRGAGRSTDAGTNEPVGFGSRTSRGVSIAGVAGGRRTSLALGGRQAIAAAAVETADGRRAARAGRAPALRRKAGLDGHPSRSAAPAARSISDAGRCAARLPVGRVPKLDGLHWWASGVTTRPVRPARST